VELSVKKVPHAKSNRGKKVKKKREETLSLSLLFPKSAPTSATKGTTAPSLWSVIPQLLLLLLLLLLR